MPELTTDPVVTFSHPNQREQVIAFVALSAMNAATFAKTKYLPIGPFSCRIRNYNPVRKCYKCLGYGHTSYTCKGPDRTDHCYKCAEKGHKASDCTNEEKCIVCKDVGRSEEDIKHLLGTGKCMTYWQARGMPNTSTRR